MIRRTPRNEAADKYSPEIAAALSAGWTSRAATMKSSGVRATRTPRAPTATVSSVTNAIAATAATSGIEPPVRRANQVNEARLTLAGLMVVEPADRHADGICPRAQNDECQREARHRYPARAWPQRGKYRQGRHDRDREREAHQRQAELCPGEGADQEPAFGGLALRVTQPDIVLNPCRVVFPDHHLP